MFNWVAKKEQKASIFSQNKLQNKQFHIYPNKTKHRERKKRLQAEMK